MLAVGVLVACILWEAGADGGNGNIIRVGVVLGVNNGTAAAGFGRALTSDQEQWCAEQGVQVIIYNYVTMLSKRDGQCEARACAQVVVASNARDRAC